MIRIMKVYTQIFQVLHHRFKTIDQATGGLNIGDTFGNFGDVSQQIIRRVPFLPFFQNSNVVVYPGGYAAAALDNATLFTNNYFCANFGCTQRGP